MPSIPQPVADWLADYNALEFILFVIAVMVAIRMMWKGAKRAIPSVKVGLAFFEALGRLPEFMSSTRERQDEQDKTLARQERLLHEVKHEVLPNNGGSMRDETTTMALRLEKVEAKLTRDHERFSAIEDELRLREQRGIGIPSSTVSPRLRASRLERPAPAEDDELEITQGMPPYPTMDEN